MKALARFFVSVKKEMKKVRWLTKKEMVKYSVAVLSIMVFLGLFFLASDTIIGFMKMVVS